MSKLKKNPSNNFPFQLESEVEFYRKWYFIHYINQLAPEVSDECKGLTEDCKELFGDFPQSLINSKNLENYKLWTEINFIVSNCIWTETGLYENF